MISYANGRAIAVLDKDENAIKKNEQVLRITEVYASYIKREVRVVLHRGIILPDKSFLVTTPEPIIISIADQEGHQKIVQKGSAVEVVTIPPRPLFTLLTTPASGQKTRWAGDFRLADIECLIVDYDLLPDIEISDILPQV